MAVSLFSEVPDNFFYPLASKHRRHYSELMLRYYHLFETYSTGVERELVLSSFEEYFADESGILFGGAALDIDAADAEAEMDAAPEMSAADAEDADMPRYESLSPRNLASIFLRRLIQYGWMSEEILADYTQVINMTMWARPFYTALEETVSGLEVEYESHVIGIYTSLCSDAAADQGHHAVLNALGHTRKLIESLKVLSQNIKTHLERMFYEEADVKELLHIHYDLYMQEIVDKAYTRLKTSDNLSKYRPPIIKAVHKFLQNEPWMEKTTAKLAVIRNSPKNPVRIDLIAMLKEIRDELRNIDPILEEIDDRNRQYSRISTEKIKSHLYADASLHGKVKTIMQAFRDQDSLHTLVTPNLLNASFLIRTSLYTRNLRRDIPLEIQRPAFQLHDTEQLEAEMRLRIENQLNPMKIRQFLDTVCRTDGTPTPAAEIISTMDDFIRVVYAAAYAEGRQGRFPYRIRWGSSMVRHGRFEFTEHAFIRLLPDETHRTMRTEQTGRNS